MAKQCSGARHYPGKLDCVIEKRAYEMSQMQEMVMVSVFMLAYNHEEFAEQAIESVLSQKTDFKYEIVIGEDCSSDRTRDICIKYQEKYPNIIKLISHDKNVGIYENMKSVYDNCIGKYIAHLECDDYWNDENKLQKQIDFLETHKECSAVVHNSYMLDYKSGKKTILSSNRKSGEIGVGKLILWNNVFQTSSLVARGEYCKNRPLFAQGVCGIGDYPTALWLGLNGKVYFFNEIMSTYRANTPGSWSANNITSDQINRNEDKVIKMLEMFDDYTGHKYSEFVNRRIGRIYISRHVREENIQALKNIGYRKIVSVCGPRGTLGVVYGLLLNKMKHL